MDIVQRVIAIKGSFGKIGDIDVDDMVAIFPKQFLCFIQKGVFAVSDDHAFVALHDIGKDISAGFSGPAGADDEIIVV